MNLSVGFWRPPAFVSCLLRGHEVFSGEKSDGANPWLSGCDILFSQSFILRIKEDGFAQNIALL